jgi:hypothetical protein
MVLTAYIVLSPVTGLFCHRRFTDDRRVQPGRADFASAKLDASFGASGPHDFAVRNNAFRLHAVSHSQAQRPALQPRLRAGAVASTASRPAFVTIASRPSWGRDGRICKSDLPDGLSKIFFETGLDTDLLICPTGSLIWPFSVIYLHPQSPGIDFIAAKTRIAVPRRNGACAGVNQIVTSDPRAVTFRQPF